MKSCIREALFALSHADKHPHPIPNQTIYLQKSFQQWKEAIIAPILKKGDSTNKSNYRPVSCLVVLSKILDKIICEQLTNFMEQHGLLPDNQHGFRAARSTMSALSATQHEWSKNTGEKLITGILIWDLSAAFDTQSQSIFCQKLKLYGFNQILINWFRKLPNRQNSERKNWKSIINLTRYWIRSPDPALVAWIVRALLSHSVEE